MATETTPEPSSYYDRMTKNGPVASEVRASNMHLLNAMEPIVYGLKVIRDNHAEKFTAEEIEALRVARRILERHEVPMCMVKLAAPKKLRRPGQK